MKIDCKDLTFLIPLRIDSIERLENLCMIVKFLNEYTSAQIHILEANSLSNGILKKILPDSVQYSFEIDNDPVFHRTYWINQMLRKVNTELVSVWDADVLVPPNQLEESIHVLRSKKADFVLPYSEGLFDTSPIIRNAFLNYPDFSFLNDNIKKMKPMYGVAVGGAYMARTKSHIESGMENEYFYGWGHEDGERVTRWRILGTPAFRVPGSMYHLTHPRNTNSTYQASSERENKLELIRKTATMNKQEILSRTRA